MKGCALQTRLTDELKSRARSFEQDLLWSILDQDAVPHILTMARNNWHVDEQAAWAALVQQFTLGRLSAYRGVDGNPVVDLMQCSGDDVREDYHLFVEPTDATFTRLHEIGGEKASNTTG